jgi:alkanesulfonate monooxygenase SsuD/methylene tetrahydromethanopterin reductase-like flavin-dependent oxidoreductase (luciferase family)
MKFGIYLPNFGPYGNARVLSELAMQAEKAGWDGFFIWDHINRYWATDVADAWVALSAIAVRTERLRIGALITALPRRRPWKVAREAATLDQLSNGRLVLGVGLGSSGGADVEWANFGEEMDLKKRAGMLDEGLEIVKGLWSGEPFAFEGKYYQVKESQFLPRPVQSPRIPVWVAGNWPNKAPFRRMARWDGMVPQTNPTVDENITDLREAIQFTHALRKTNDPFDVAYSAPPAKAAEQSKEYEAAGVTWLLVQLYPQHFGGAMQGDWPLDAMQAYMAAGPKSS